MERHLDEVDLRLERLRTSRELYAGLIDRAKGLDPADCTDPDRCQTIAATSGHAERTLSYALPDNDHGHGARPSQQRSDAKLELLDLGLGCRGRADLLDAGEGEGPGTEASRHGPRSGRSLETSGPVLITRARTG
jgi:hypothetical protein